MPKFSLSNLWGSLCPPKNLPPQSFYRLGADCQIPGLGLLYEKYLGLTTEGCFVEVGAYDGEYVSNTCALADMGWKGFYIEPVPEYFERCRKRHAGNGAVLVRNVAIGDREDTVTLNIGGPLSTMNDKMVDNFLELDWAKTLFSTREQITVKQVTLQEFLTAQQVPVNFDLLVIDVEGYEWTVLKNFDIALWQPKMVIIELHDTNDDYLLIRQECLDIVDYFERNGYRPVFKDNTNTVFVSAEYAEGQIQDGAPT